jgi:hypothetical protein
MNAFFVHKTNAVSSRVFPPETIKVVFKLCMAVIGYSARRISSELKYSFSKQNTWIEATWQHLQPHQLIPSLFSRRSAK